MNKITERVGKKAVGDIVYRLNDEDISMSDILFIINAISKNEIVVRGNNNLWRGAVRDAIDVETTVDDSFCEKWFIKKRKWL